MAAESGRRPPDRDGGSPQRPRDGPARVDRPRTEAGQPADHPEETITISIIIEEARVLVEHQTRVLDRDGHPLGLLAQIYVDEDTEEPVWAAVVFTQPSTVETVVPIHDATVVDDDLTTRYPRDVIEAGPRITAGDELPWIEEERLRLHYSRYAPIGAESVVVPVTDVDAADRTPPPAGTG